MKAMNIMLSDLRWDTRTHLYKVTKSYSAMDITRNHNRSVWIDYAYEYEYDYENQNAKRTLPASGNWPLRALPA